MTWQDITNSNKYNWKTIIEPFDLNSFKNIDIFDHSHLGTKNRKLIYIEDKLIKSFTIIKIKKYLFCHVINISGGLEGDINNLILNNLIFYLKSNFKFFVCKIDLNLTHTNTISFNDKNFITSDPRFNFFKEFNNIANIDELKKTFSSNWRHNLNRSNKNKFTILNEIPNPIEIFNLYEELSIIKKIKNPYTLIYINNVLNKFRNKIFISQARVHNKLVSIRGIIFHNNKSWDLFSASNLTARKIYASYAVTFEILKYCLFNNIKVFDLSGIDYKKNRSVYNFKKGMGPIEKKIYPELIFSSSIIFHFFFKIIFKLRIKYFV